MLKYIVYLYKVFKHFLLEVYRIICHICHFQVYQNANSGASLVSRASLSSSGGVLNTFSERSRF